MRGSPLVCGLLMMGCGVSDPSDPVDDGKADGFQSSAAVKRESAVAAVFDSAKADAGELTKLVSALPKGGDLHMHLSGAAVTESLIGWGQDAHDCVTPAYVAERFPRARMVVLAMRAGVVH